MISNRLLKHFSISLRYPLMLCFNKSFTEGNVPNLMKIAKVTPLHKGGDARLCDNYRPISVLPSMSKLIEKIVFNRVINHLEANNLLYSKQFGFRRNHSTIDAVQTLVGDILKGFDEGLTCLSVMIDLRKAFDTCSHHILLAKLEQLGIKGNLLRWFESYLSDRYQYVKIENCTFRQATNICRGATRRVTWCITICNSN